MKYIAVVMDDKSHRKIAKENRVLVLENVKIFDGVRPGEIVKWANLTLSLYGTIGDEEAIFENQMGFFVDDIPLIYRHDDSIQKWRLWTGDDHWNQFWVEDILSYALTKLERPYDTFGKFNIRTRSLYYKDGKPSSSY